MQIDWGRRAARAQVLLGLMLAMMMLVAADAEAVTFRCKAMAVYLVNNASGKPERHPHEELLLNANAGSWIFDIPDGVSGAKVRVINALGNSFEYVLQQEGGRDNDYVATRVYRGPASTPVSVARVRTWGKASTTFAVMESDQLTTGVCSTGP